MTRCLQCQHENEPGAKFCEECAAALARACAKCGRALSPTAKFCPECAHPTGLPGAPSTAQRFDSPESYTPRHLAEKILTSKSALEGERKQVTVLFADLKGSMELLAGRDPEEARKILDPVLEHMMEAVHRYEGTVNQVMGDGIMALFGAPLAHEDHAVRACYAALRMQETVKRYAEGVRRQHGVTVRIRVGLNSGEVVVRAIGSDLHMDYTAVGQTTHLAARMEQMALPGVTLLTSATLQFAEGYVEVRTQGPVSVKGLPEPVEVYELIGAGAVRSRLHAAAARGLTRFVGRDSEADQLRQALERAQAGHGQVVATVGEPGVGKSRLYWEFTHSHRAHGWLILEAGSVSYGKATAYLPVIDLLKAYFHIEGQDDTRIIREKVTGKVLSLDRALEPSLSALLALLEVPVEDEVWGRLDPPQRRQQTLDAVKRLLLRESQVQPLLVLVEDLHWIDAETQALLDSLVESLPAARLLLLVNYRPEYHHSWANKTYYQQLRIDPLPGERADELLRNLLGPDISLEPLTRALIERTDGNPLFLEESVRTLAETRALVGEPGAYRLAADAPPIQLPPTVQAILAARIDRLPSEDKRLLQAAAAIGKDVPLSLLQAVADESEATVRAGLTRLQATEFLYETRLYPDLELTFKHALTHEVAYASLLHERRRVMHRRIVDALKRVHAGRLEAQVERLAYHAMRGEEWEDAVDNFRRASAKAMVRSANREAVAYLEQALLAHGRLPDDSATVGRGIDLHFDLRDSLWPLGAHGQVLEHLQRAQALAEQHGDERRLTRALVYLTHYFLTEGQYGRALVFGERAFEAASSLADPTLEVQAKLRLSQTYLAAGRFPEVVEKTVSVVESLKTVGHGEWLGLPVDPGVFARHILIFALSALGRFAEGTRHAEEALDSAGALGHPFTVWHALFAAGSLYTAQGMIERAIPLLEQALSLSETAQLAVGYPNAASVLGLARLRVSREVDGALRLLESGVERALSIRFLQGHAGLVARLGEGYLLVDRLTDAQMFATRALAISRDTAARGVEAIALQLLGAVASRQDPSDFQTPVGHYCEAMVLAAELGMRPLVAHCHLGLGTLYRRTGQREQAQEHLVTATAMFREMNMRFWLEQAEAEMRQLR